MGFFDFAEEEQQSAITLSEAEAFIGINLAMVAADGQINEDELMVMTTYLTRMKMYRQESEESIKAMFDKVLQIMQDQGIGALVAAANQGLSVKLKLAAFACALDLALADGEVAESEQALIQEMQHVLGVDNETTQLLVKATMIKNLI